MASIWDYCECCGKRIEVGEWCVETYVAEYLSSRPVTFCRDCVTICEHAGADMRGEE